MADDDYSSGTDPESKRSKKSSDDSSNLFAVRGMTNPTATQGPATDVGTTNPRDWKTFVKPLTTAAAMYGGARWAGADPLTAGIAGAVGGLAQVPGPHQQVLSWAMRPFTGSRQAAPQPKVMPTQPTVNAPAQAVPSTAQTGPYASFTPGQASLNPITSNLPTAPSWGMAAPTSILAQAPRTPLVPDPTQDMSPDRYGVRGGSYQGGGLLSGSGLQDIIGDVDAVRGLTRPQQPTPDVTSQIGKPMARGGLPDMPGSSLGRMAGIPNPEKGLHLRNPAGLGGGSSSMTVNPMRLLARSLNPLRQMNPLRAGRLGMPRMRVLAQGGPVGDDGIANTRGNDWFFENMATRTVPKGPDGILPDVADKSNENVKKNLPKEAKKMTKGFQRGGPIRGRMSEAMGGPKVPGSDAENPFPGGKGGKGKAAPMKFAKGGQVRGAGCVVSGVRPAKKY